MRTRERPYDSERIATPKAEVLAVVDGQGGRLALDLTLPDINILADACNLIAKGPLPHGARTLTVALDSDTYMVTYRMRPEARAEVELASTRDPHNGIRLAPEMVQVLASMILEAVAHRA